jgi:hypothetical protein
MDEGKKRSIDRAKKTAIASVGVALACYSTTQVGPEFTATAALLVKQAGVWLTDRSISRVEKLTKCFEKGLSNDEANKLYRCLKKEDVFNVINYLVNDEEDKKTPYYSKLLRYLARKGTVLSEAERVTLIKQFRNLDAADFPLILEACKIQKVLDAQRENWLKNHVGGVARGLTALRDKYKNDPRQQTLLKLENMGIVEDTAQRLTKYGAAPHGVRPTFCNIYREILLES